MTHLHNQGSNKGSEPSNGKESSLRTFSTAGEFYNGGFSHVLSRGFDWVRNFASRSNFRWFNIGTDGLSDRNCDSMVLGVFSMAVSNFESFVDCDSLLGDNGCSDCSITSMNDVKVLLDEPDFIDVDVVDRHLLGVADFGRFAAPLDDRLTRSRGWISAVTFESEIVGLGVDDVCVSAVDGIELETIAISR